jgi:L-histidine Nalpha-methyltransferase
MIEAPEALREAVLREAVRGLVVPAGTQKTLPPWLFYDERGSELFSEITRLPEYYLTRSERAIFEEYADDIVSEGTGPLNIAELGAGTAEKTGILLRAALRRQAELLYQPIDVSASALDEAVASLAGVPGLTIKPKVANYITDAYTLERTRDQSLVGLYIGSSVGNFSPAEAVSILRNLRRQLRRTGDSLVLGVDLAPCRNKSVEFLLAAYDDAAGVTAEFNRNILARLNRDLETNFDLACFAHRARWNAAESRIEMHLESLCDQTVQIDGKPVTFVPGETIHTENSYKFTERSVRALLDHAGFGSPRWFHDTSHLFGVALAHPA